jgi:hypothetical protein
LAESSEVSIVAFTETRESRAVELLRVERAVGVEEAIGINLRRGYDKKLGVRTFLKKIFSIHRKVRPNEIKEQGGTNVRRTSVLAFEPLFA